MFLLRELNSCYRSSDLAASLDLGCWDKEKELKKQHYVPDIVLHLGC